ncbi:MAG: GNAT family N-acetyltransferase [Coriobacteriales bacterium]|jgi:N-acetylglutamate synthase-like GNAT family acetyltransferase|nr:GNAT family N-acetyltransferase [Coriobacteriales bacterium]
MSDFAVAAEEGSSLFSLRPAQLDDLPGIRVVSDDARMPAIESVAHCLVAVNDDDEAVGFIRLKLLPDPLDPALTVPYVYPVAVHSTWQGLGVGTALVKAAAQRYGQLRLVACSRSQGFYEQLGMARAPWESIAPEIAGDCTWCPDAAHCTPQPYWSDGENIG